MAEEDCAFASMDPTKQRELASKGGKATHLRAPLTNGAARKREKPAARAAWQVESVTRSHGRQ